MFKVPCRLLPIAFSSAAALLAQPESLTVDRVIEYALANNRGLQAFRQTIPEARGARLQAGLRINPSLDLAATNGAVIGNPGVYDLSAGYSHTFELVRKRDRRVELAEAQLSVAGLELSNQERLLRSEVRTAYLTVQAAQRNLANARDLLVVTDDNLRLVSARVTQGESPPLDRSLLTVETSRIQADIRLFQNQATRAEAELRTLAGLPPDAGLKLASSIDQVAAPPPLDSALSKALETRPDLAAIRAFEKARQAEVRLERSQAVPNLTAFGRFAYNYDNIGRFTRGGAAPVSIVDRDPTVSAGVSIALPTRNRNQGNIAAAGARAEQATLRTAYLEQIVVREVRSAYERLEAAQEAIRLYEGGVLRQSNDNLRVVRGAYELGELRLLDVINEQRRLVEAQRAFTELLRERQLSIAEVERSTGIVLAETKQ